MEEEQPIEVTLQDDIAEPIAEDPEKRDQWEEVLPRIPDQDVIEANNLMEEIRKKYSKKVLSSYAQIEELREYAEYRFKEDLHMIVSVSWTPRARLILAPFVSPVKLVYGKDWTFDEDGSMLVAPRFDSTNIIWEPSVVIQDYADIETKKKKTEEAVGQRERRRAMGDDYWDFYGPKRRV